MRHSNIEWTDATWNPSVGCNKVSAGCKHCYAETMSRRLKAMGVSEYSDGFAFKDIPERLDIPRAIKKPTKFFFNSMSDLFHEKMPSYFLDSVFKVIRATPQHIYQILTKRADRMVEYCKNTTIPSNAWMGVTVENTKSIGRIAALRQVNAQTRFISFEPLLEDLGKLDLSGIHWAIVGGESGPKARPMDLNWALSIKDQCKYYNVAFFFKQWGAYGPDGIKRSKKANGRLLDGIEYNEEPWPLPSR